MLGLMHAVLRYVTIFPTDIPEDERLADPGWTALYEALELDTDQTEAIDSLKLQVADERFELAFQSIQIVWKTARESASNVAYRF